MKPILFTTLMVQAILQGSKSQTRRIIKPQPISDFDSGPVIVNTISPQSITHTEELPKYARYQVGNILWVRETFIETFSIDDKIYYEYKADYSDTMADEVAWKPSIFMPKAAARIFLEVTRVRAERLQDISEKDALAEGVELQLPSHLFKNYRPGTEPKEGFSMPFSSYETLWRQLNGGESWNSNPWVWVYEFKLMNYPL